MIAYLKGSLLYKSLEFIIIEVNGVGYQVSIPFSLYEKLPNLNSNLELYTYLYPRENYIDLYGFSSIEERKLFQILIGVSGVGPKLAMAILSSISSDEFKLAILKNDVNKLTTIPGIGKKTAERVILELRDKVASLPEAKISIIDIEKDQVMKDAISGLVNYGYPNILAEKTVKSILQEYPNLSMLEVIKEAFKRLSSKK